jgi:D-alanyl-D-alanine carboxypeptidase
LASAHPEIDGITVEQLLGMTSGIPDYANTGLVLQQVVRTPDRLWTPDEIIDLSITKLKLEKPGTPGYSTTNFLILGEIVSEVTGESIESVLNETAADAGLEQTKLLPGDENDMPAPASSGYVNAPGVESLAAADIKVKPGIDVTEWTQSWGGAGGSMYSTVDELGEWAATGLGTSQLSQSLGDERLDDTTELEGMGKYGLGIQHFGEDWIGHTGQIIGWEAIAMYNPQTGGTISAIINETGSIGPVIMMILDLYPELKVSDFT